MRLELEGGYRIRSYRAGDEAALVEHADNRNVSRNLRDRFPYPYTPEVARNWLAHVATEEPEVSFAIATREGLIGGIGVELGEDIHHRTAEIGFWLGERFWGRGITTAAVRAFTPWAFERYDLLRIWAGVFETNPASARVLEKAGYTLEARLRASVVKDGRTLDQLVYARLRHPPPRPPESRL
jgi:RimJ/RimL family protein N-acetyltransferase